MSDMIQLVVKTGEISISEVTGNIIGRVVASLDDKLKHVGHNSLAKSLDNLSAPGLSCARSHAILND